MEQVEDEVDLPEEGPGGYHGSMDDSKNLLLVYYPLVMTNIAIENDHL